MFTKASILWEVPGSGFAFSAPVGWSKPSPLASTCCLCVEALMWHHPVQPEYELCHFHLKTTLKAYKEHVECFLLHTPKYSLLNMWSTWHYEVELRIYSPPHFCDLDIKPTALHTHGKCSAREHFLSTASWFDWPHFKGSLSTCICFVWGHTVFRGWTVINVDHPSLQESELWHHDEWSWWLIFCARVCTPAVWTSWFLQILEANKIGQQAWVVGPFQPTRALFGFCNPGWCCWNHLPTSLPLCLHLRTVSA